MSQPLLFSRSFGIEQLEKNIQWDMVVIGGGATGLGIALDSANRGYKTLLLEQTDFAKGTSSRSTKLIHGGVRYLAQGDIALVYSALDERAILLKNAQHLVKPQSFIIPCYNYFSLAKYIVGLKLYDWLSGRFSFGRSELLKRYNVVAKLPTIITKGLKAGVQYFDGQFDDARLAINLAQTCAEMGGVLVNYCKVTGLLKNGKTITGVQVTDLEDHTTFEVRAKVVVNATGVFVDEILHLDNAGNAPLVRPSQGIHLVLPKRFLNGDNALMIPKTSDGRVLFAVPWHGHLLAGTTDTPLDHHSEEPVALEKEIDFILGTLASYLQQPATRHDVLSIFAGLRPLAASSKTGSTKEISRDHKLAVSQSGLVTITGGKWTTYRKMAEETVDKAIQVAGLNYVACKTRQVSIHGNTTFAASVYGSDEELVKELIAADQTLSGLLAEGMPYCKAHVIWAVRFEMARTVEDVLARRTRVLFLNARAAIEAAPTVAQIMATELGYDMAWIEQQVETFKNLAKHYLPAM